jgi:aminoglycoside phosphotransferase (APT) family kinase protein
LTGVGEDLAAQLAADVGKAMSWSQVEISGLTRLSGGASRETWAFDAISGDETLPLILRRDPPGAPRTRPGGMPLEARVLRAATSVGVPVPEVVTSGDDFIVMRRIEGETIARKILRDEEYAPARPLLAGQCGQVLARLHTLDPERIAGLVEQDQVAQYREVLDNLHEPHPAFELGFRWLDAHRPQSSRRAVVHGDFRHGNLIIGPDGLRAVLDWELVHVGDPMEDLGWLCVKAWRFGVAENPVGGFGSYDELVDAYEAESGARVDRDALRWWEVLGTLKWGVMCIMQRSAHTSGALRSVELAAIGRRVCENEWDLLELIA